MKTVYGRINSDLYKIEIYPHTLIGERVKALPKGATWEDVSDQRGGLLPSEILYNDRGEWRTLFSSWEVEDILRKVENIEEALVSEVYKRWGFGSIRRKWGEGIRYDFLRLRELINESCMVLTWGRAIVLFGSPFLVVYEPIR